MSEMNAKRIITLSRILSSCVDTVTLNVSVGEDDLPRLDGEETLAFQNYRRTF